MENNFQINTNKDKDIQSRNILPNYSIMAKSHKNNNIIRKDKNDSLNFSEISEEIERKTNKLKSTNFIIHLKKSKTKNSKVNNFI